MTVTSQPIPTLWLMMLLWLHIVTSLDGLGQPVNSVLVFALLWLEFWTFSAKHVVVCALHCKSSQKVE